LFFPNFLLLFSGNQLIMKFVIEFGHKKGNHIDNLIVNSNKQAAQIASGLAHIFNNDIKVFPNEGSENGGMPSFWIMKRSQVRIIWESPLNYIAVSKLDGVGRGPAMTDLWGNT